MIMERSLYIKSLSPLWFVSIIINSSPIVPISSDPENAIILSPNVLLMQDEGDDLPPLQNMETRDMFKANWKHAQVLAERFW